MFHVLLSHHVLYQRRHLSNHSVSSSPHLSPSISSLLPVSFQVYDAVGYAPARFWMLRRSAPPAAASSNASDARAVPEPGDPYRYLLPEDTTGLTQVAVLHDELAHLSTLQTTYSMLQASLTELCRCSNLRCTSVSDGLRLDQLAVCVLAFLTPAIGTLPSLTSAPHSAFPSSLSSPS